MTTLNFYKTTLLLITFLFFVHSAKSQDSELDLQELVGIWKLDLSPENKTDSNFAYMKIDSISNNRVIGDFYREGVAIREGRTNIQSGKIYIALVSGDNSGDYNTAFYLENGKIYGSTHALDRDFLAVWIGEKQK